MSVKIMNNNVNDNTKLYLPNPISPRYPAMQINKKNPNTEVITCAMPNTLVFFAMVWTLFM